MKLYAMQRIPPMTDPHYNAVVGFRGYLKLFRKTLRGDHEGVIPCRDERLRHIRIDTGTRMVNLGRPPVHQHRGVNDFSSERQSDRLVSQTNAEYGNGRGKLPYHVHRNPRVLRTTRTG